MKLFRTATARFVEEDGHQYRIGALTWDALIAHDNLEACLEAIVESEAPTHEFRGGPLLAPIDRQEVWAAGVTYLPQPRGAHGGIASRPAAAISTIGSTLPIGPELFFKATASRVVGPGGRCAIRPDANWTVPSRSSRWWSARAARSLATPSATT